MVFLGFDSVDLGSIFIWVIVYYRFGILRLFSFFINSCFVFDVLLGFLEFSSFRSRRYGTFKSVNKRQCLSGGRS